jgi:NAD-dependent dihydropyrimidine dehydrogenase PreA subunit
MKRPEVVKPENCSGCSICELACSFHNGPDRSFRPSAAHLRAVRTEGLNRFRIEFSPDCNGCGLCAAHCGYGVFGAPIASEEGP